jgi:4-hydroxy-2-oxoheptanedioate aldolase
MQHLKKRVLNGETLHGCWLNLGSPLTAEIVGLSGFDWVLIDLEHGAGAEISTLHQLQALKSTQAVPIVRVESNEAPRIGRVLDMGAMGVMCPKINDANEAKKAVNGLLYPPHGNRGVAKMVRATEFGLKFQSYYDSSTEELLGIIQIETLSALENVHEIAAVEGVDVLFIGPADLTMELGIFGQFDHPIFIDAVNLISSTAKKFGKATGILFFNLAEYEKYHAMGIRFLACGADATFVAEGARNMAKNLNELRKNT